MGKFTYIGEDSRTYEDRSIEVESGDVVEWGEEAPDYRWEPAPENAVITKPTEAPADPPEGTPEGSESLSASEGASVPPEGSEGSSDTATPTPEG